MRTEPFDMINRDGKSGAYRFWGAYSFIQIRNLLFFTRPKYLFLTAWMWFTPFLEAPAQDYNQSITVKFYQEQDLIEYQKANQPTLPKKTSSLSLDPKWERVFPLAGKFEEKHRSHGLHLWYRLRFDSTVIETKEMLKSLTENSNIELTEINQVKANSVPLDSLFNKQWSFNNTGQREGLIGHDVGFINSSKLESGDPRVVISIHDSGIDLYNPELTANLWVNEGEIPDNGIDDDDNGYIDDVHGYGFGERNNKLNDTHGHGSHIAGVIAAKWDGKGVNGLAGGSTDQDGVRLMICRLDWDTPGLDIIRPEESIVYAADNGAIISQNSWNTYGISYSVKAAIAYFAAEAGNEMLHGGIVVFSAGNNGSYEPRYEGEHPRVMMVANIDRYSRLNIWSNYGSWIDVCAPGTDIFSNGTFGNYEYMSGTSMAAPHVTAVVALVVSKYGHPSFSPEEAIAKVKTSAVNINEFNYFTMENGRINAFGALLDVDVTGPDPVEEIQIEPRAFDAVLSWPSPYDNTIAPFYYVIALSESEISENNFIESVFDTLEIRNPEYMSTVFYTLDSLKASTTYHMAIMALDYFKNASLLSEVVVFDTQLEPHITFQAHQTQHQFHVDSTYRDSWTITNTGDSELDWSLSKSNAEDTLIFRDLKVGIFTVYHQYTLINEYIESHGGKVIEIAKDFHESDLKGIQLILLEGGINTMDSSKAPILSNWVKRGGNLIFAVNGQYSFDINNSYIRDFGASYKKYDATNEMTTENFIANSPFTKGVYELKLLYYETYLETTNLEFVPLVWDNSGNVTATIASFHKGKVLLASNNFWGGYYIDFSDNYTFAKNTIKWFADHTSIRFSKNQGTVSAHESETIEVDFNHNAGDGFKSYVYLTTNDPENHQIRLDYALNITGYALAKQEKSSIDFDTVYVGISVDSTFTLYNKGLDSLYLFRLPNSNPVFQSSIDTIALGSNDSILVRVTFLPIESGALEDTFVFVGNTPDSVRVGFKGYSQWPPVLQSFPVDSLVVRISNEPQIRSVFVKNIGKGVDLNGSVALRPARPTELEEAKIEFSGKRIGISGMNQYANALFYLDLIGNEVFDFKTNLSNNPYPLDSIDLIILDHRIYNITNSNLDQIVNWINNGGNLIIQTDVSDNPSKLDKIFRHTSTRQIGYYFNYQRDTLKDLILHPITENLEYLLPFNNYSYLESTDPGKVLAYDSRNNPQVVYDYVGEGKVLFASDNIFYVPSPNPDLRFLVQSLNWLINPEKEFWVDFDRFNFDLKSNKVMSGDISFRQVGSGNHWAKLEIKSNDPSIPVKDIGVKYTFDVLHRATNQTPEVNPFQNKRIAENPPNNLVLDTLKALDRDGDKLYFFTTDIKGVDINNSSGKIYVKDSSYLDFELRTIVEVMFFMTDLIDTVAVPFSLSIENINEKPLLIQQILDMDEDSSAVFVIQYSDPENDDLIVDIQLIENVGLEVAHWRWQNLTHELFVEPMPNQNGLISFDLMLDDGINRIDTILSVHVKPINDAPWFTSISTAFIILDSAYTLTIRLADIDSDTLWFSMVNEPSGILEPVEPMKIIKTTDSTKLDFTVRGIQIGILEVQMYLTDGLDSMNYTYILEVKSMESVLSTAPELAGINIYPIPSFGQLYIDSKFTPILSAKMFDLSGRLIDLDFHNTNSNHQKVDTHHLSKGTYILNLETRWGISKFKILVQ